MPKNKLCCRIFPIVAILISGVINAAIWYFDEGVHEFAFLTEKGEFFNYLGFTLAGALFPIGIFYYLNDKEEYQAKARPLALLGFIPILLMLLFVLF